MDTPEKAALIVFSMILFAIATFFHVKHMHVSHDVAITQNGIRRVCTLKEIDEASRESRRIAINTATQAELTLIPGIGYKFASRIIEYRSMHGPFRKAQDLIAVQGIGPVKLSKMEKFIKIDE
jgi:competence ComEA-like helix-hairpin-helix protein